MIDLLLIALLWGKPKDLPTSSNPKVFTSSTTWTCPWSGNWSVTCIGGGGKGGAHTTNQLASQFSQGGGGGGAGYVTTKTVALTKGTAYAVTVGAAAGNSSFGGSLVTANKGANGSGATGGAGGAKGSNGGASSSASQIGGCTHFQSVTLPPTPQGSYPIKASAGGAGGNNNSGYGKGGTGGKATKAAGTYNQGGNGKHSVSVSASTAPSNGTAGAVKIYFAG